MFRNKSNLLFETKQIFAKQNKKNVRWISMKQKFVSQHSNITLYHILNAYFLREIISFQGYRALLKLMILYNDDDDTEDEEEFENMVLFYEFISSR
jgi:hypothetical protein